MQFNLRFAFVKNAFYHERKCGMLRTRMENEPTAKGAKKFDKNFEAKLNFMDSLAFEIAIPREIAFADVPEGVSFVRDKNNYIEFGAGGRNWPIYIVHAVTSVSLSVLAN